jgi:hypothetical protein
MPRPITRIKGHYAADGGFRKGKGAAVIVEEALFTATDITVAGSLSASIAIPAGATILDILVRSTELWNSGTSDTLIVGDDDDPDGFYTGVDLQSGGELLVGEILTFDTGATAAVENTGAYLNHAGAGRDTYRATANNVIGKITSVGTIPTTGSLIMQVVYAPKSFKQTLAAFTAT